VIEHDEDNLDVRRLWRIIWLRLPLIIGIVVVAVVGIYTYSSLQTDLYQSTAKIRVVDPNAQAVFDGMQIRVDPKREVDTQIQLIESPDLRNAVNEKLGDDATKITSIAVSSVGSTDLINITVSSPSPEVAQVAANAMAELFVIQRRAQVTSSFTERADELRSKASEIDAQITAIDVQLADTDISVTQAEVLGSQRYSLVTQQADLRTRATQFDVEAATRSGSAEVSQTALLATSPYLPSPRRDAALAGILALLLGIGLAFLLDRLSNTVRTAEDVDNLGAGVAVIGGIPIFGEGEETSRHINRKGQRSIVPIDSIAAEAFRGLASNLRFSALGGKRTRVLVTSAEGSEGKSTLVANLAAILAESGQQVVFVSGDLRKPSIETFFDINTTDSGLTRVLLGDESLDDAITSVVSPSSRRLAILPAGPLPQNPAEVVGSEAMGALLDRLESSGVDFILIDSPPLLPVADSLTLSQFANGAIVVALVGETPRDHLRETLERLQQVNTPIIGVVLNGVPSKGRYSRYYGTYSYGSYSYKNKYSQTKGKEK
jgi:capsular exopolysaccharide synthesis family protein